jgi:hypothetical protein
MSSTVQQALTAYFKAYDLGDEGGLNRRWGKIRVWKFYVPIPNTAARRKALVFHDIHHIVTGYGGNWKGEVSISAWEIASGCGKYYAAWILDLWGMGIGLVIYPKNVYRAFVRGLRTKNLYINTIPQDEALGMPIPELKKKLLLDHEHTEPASLKEIFSFIRWSAAGTVAYAVPFVIPYVLLIWWLLK